MVAGWQIIGNYMKGQRNFIIAWARWLVRLLAAEKYYLIIEVGGIL